MPFPARFLVFTLVLIVSAGTALAAPFVVVANGGSESVSILDAATDTVVGTVPVGFVTDGCDVTVPLSLLGNDDGRFNLRVRVYAEPALPVVLDSMPDAGLARVQ